MNQDTAELQLIRDGLNSGKYILIDTNKGTEFKTHLVNDYLNNRILKQLLKKWRFYETSFNFLTDNELDAAKALFFRLSYLPKDEKDFLAAIFRDHCDDLKLNSLSSWIASHFELENEQVAYKKLSTILHKLNKPRERPKGFKQSGYNYAAVKIRGVAWY